MIVSMRSRRGAGIQDRRLSLHFLRLRCCHTAINKQHTRWQTNKVAAQLSVTVILNKTRCVFQDTVERNSLVDETIFNQRFSVII